MEELSSPPSSPEARDLLVRTLEKNYALAEAESKDSFLRFLGHWVINSVPPRPFRRVAEPWQWTIAAKMAPAVEWVAQVSRKYDGPTRYIWVMPKGHDKTPSIGRLLTWGMAFARTHLTAYATAKDRDQAGLLLDSMQVEADLNPWVKKRVSFKNWKVLGHNSSKLHIEATDAGGFQGVRGDLLLIDELTQWEDKKFFTDIISGINKRPRGVMIAIMNAGVRGSWQHEFVEEASRLQAEGKPWLVYQAPGPLATWMSRDRIDETRRLMPPAYGKMLFDNVWADPNQDSQYLTREQCLLCEDPSLPPALERGVSGRRYFVGVDYGSSKDRTALCVCHVEGEVLVVDRLDVWQGAKEDHVRIAKVEGWLDRVLENFDVECVVIDRWQLESTIQKYQSRCPVEVFEPRSGTAGNYAMAENFRTLVINRKVRWHPHCGAVPLKNGWLETLSDELASVVVKIVGASYRVTNPPGTHDDKYCALAMPALRAMKTAPRKVFDFSDLWF